MSGVTINFSLIRVANPQKQLLKNGRRLNSDQCAFASIDIRTSDREWRLFVYRIANCIFMIYCLLLLCKRFLCNSCFNAKMVLFLMLNPIKNVSHCQLFSQTFLSWELLTGVFHINFTLHIFVYNFSLTIKYFIMILKLYEWVLLPCIPTWHFCRLRQVNPLSW